MKKCTDTPVRQVTNYHSLPRKRHTLKRRKEGEADTPTTPHHKIQPDKPRQKPLQTHATRPEQPQKNTETKLAKLKHLLKLHQIRHITLTLKLARHERCYCAELAVGDG